MKIMIGCHAASCPDLVPGDTVRAEYIDDAGPQTDVPATRINRCVKP